jgi:hypothetical protein
MIGTPLKTLQLPAFLHLAEQTLKAKEGLGA